MKIITLPVSDLHPADYNPRKDLAPGDKQYEKLARSIETFGYVEPIVWNRTTGNIVGGHQRLKVLLQKGYTEVQVVEVELNEQEERILNVSLNKISGRWDNEKLTAILDELKEQGEMALTGFDDWELDALKVTYDHIEDLLNEDFSDTGKSEPNSYTMTFTPCPRGSRGDGHVHQREPPQARLSWRSCNIRYRVLWARAWRCRVLAAASVPAVPAKLSWRLTAVASVTALLILRNASARLRVCALCTEQDARRRVCLR